MTALHPRPVTLTNKATSRWRFEPVTTDVDCFQPADGEPFPTVVFKYGNGQKLARLRTNYDPIAAKST
jgi:hypothetical protein